VLLGASYVTTPATGVAPGPVNVKVAPLIDVEFIGTLKVAVTNVLGQTPAAPLLSIA
jgi:chromate transport protein ChrA